MKASLLHNRQNTFKNYVFYVWHNIGTKLSQTGTSLRFTAQIPYVRMYIVIIHTPAGTPHPICGPATQETQARGPHPGFPPAFLIHDNRRPAKRGFYCSSSGRWPIEKETEAAPAVRERRLLLYQQLCLHSGGCGPNRIHPQCVPHHFRSKAFSSF